MPTTVIVQRVARYGQEEALIAAMLDRVLVAAPGKSTHAYVLQSQADRRVMLYVGDWASRAAYLQRPLPHGDHVDELCDGPPQAQFFHQLIAHQNLVQRPSAITCTVFRVPADQVASTVADLIQRTGPIIEQQPGCTFHRVYQNEDDPTHLVAMSGWRSLVDNMAFQERVKHLAGELLERGVIIERFHSRTRGDIDRRYVSHIERT